jgi:Domain of unknown function (DUF1877)
MGMTCTLCRATEDEINRLIEDPAAVRSFLDPNAVGVPQVKTVRLKGLAGLILRLFPITITEVASESEPAEGAPAPMMDPDRSIDIEKGWHGLHFLFTGTADEGEEPACYLVRGGEDLDDEGQTRALRANQVRRFAEYLSALTPGELTRRYDPERMTKLEIYPDVIWMRSPSPGDSPLEWLLECFSEVRRFMDRAAAAECGVIIDIS